MSFQVCCLDVMLKIHVKAITQLTSMSLIGSTTSVIFFRLRPDQESLPQIMPCHILTVSINQCMAIFGLP